MDDKTRLKKLRKIIAMVADNEWDFFEFVDDHFAGDMVACPIPS